MHDMHAEIDLQKTPMQPNRTSRDPLTYAYNSLDLNDISLPPMNAAAGNVCVGERERGGGRDIRLPPMNTAAGNVNTRTNTDAHTQPAAHEYRCWYCGGG